MDAWDRLYAVLATFGADPDEVLVEAGPSGARRGRCSVGTVVVTTDDDPDIGDHYDLGGGSQPLPEEPPAEIAAAVAEVLANRPPD